MKMAKLALLAGVSVSTVSKAFSGSREISEEKREEIFRIARENGVYDKYCKRKPDKKIIGVVCPEYHSGYYSRQLMLLDKEIRQRGGIMLVGCSGFDENGRKELITYYSECVKADGIIVYDYFRHRSNEKINTPVVVLGDNDVYDSVCISFKSALCEAIRHFAENGHRDIAFIGEKLTHKKCRSFEEAMRENGLVINKDYIIETTERFEECGYEVMEKLLKLENPPTAVLTAYDNIAFGAMKCIKEHGLDVPEDISVIGMDDVSGNRYLDVPLSSITFYDEDLCQILIDTLFERIKNGVGTRPKKIKVSLELVKRGSVGKAKKKEIKA